ncbi:Haloacid dehalogenase-like hydrolase-domain-containing protein [Apiospora hydei]|uniref:Haloacid dehalogenase-like hydrolase-domain-containing protein n=1 Tax=Apiospora hydei TaxID=1337664 RepID=A0ABR1UUM0_9PEZI
MLDSRPINTIILDIGDVLCSWEPSSALPIQPKLLKEFRTSPIWREYNCGLLSQDECYARLATHYGIPFDDITTAFDLARASQGQNDDVVGFIRELRASHPDLRVYAMSNISRPDWEILQAKAFDWDIFDFVFTSSEAGMCKPELRFYQHVLSAANITASEAVFVDDKAENVLAAKSLGFREGIVFDKAEMVREKLLALLEDPVVRSRQWLRAHARNLHSETSTGVVVPDNFGQLLVYELMEDLSLIELKHFDRTWNYFIGAPFGTSENYPNDVDTTSYALKVLSPSLETSNSVMDEMISPEMVTADGIVKVYFDRIRDRTDPTVCVNVIRLFYTYGRGQDPGLAATKKWVQDVLLHRAYENGTRYYHQPDVFLYFFARLLRENPQSDLHRSQASTLRDRLRERVNVTADPMALGMRVLACHYMGIRDEADLRQLLKKQQADGAFEIGWLCQYGKTGVKLGHQGLTTALAVKAIEAINGSSEASYGSMSPTIKASLARKQSEDACSNGGDSGIGY